MNPPLGPQPRQRRYSVRRQARLDAETSARLEALAATFRRKRAQILRHAMPWGLAHTHEWTVDRSLSDGFHLVHLLVDSELYSSRCTRPQPPVARASPPGCGTRGVR